MANFNDFTYTKISELPTVTNIVDNDVFIVNASGTSSKISKSNLAKAVLADTSITELEAKVTQLESKVIELEQTVIAQTNAINNIITAGFNLIGIN